MTVKKIVSGDPEYTLVHAAWVENNYSSQFDMTYFEDLGGGQEGGAIFQVLDASADEPDFYMRYSKGPTLFNENSASERPTQRGYMLLSKDYWKAKYHFDREGRFKIEQDDAPNELA